MAEVFDVVLIGAGPGGYTGAIRAAQLGLKTAVIEKDQNSRRHVPERRLHSLQGAARFASEHYAMLRHTISPPTASKLVNGVELDLADLKQMMARKDKVVKDLTGGIVFLFKKNKIEWPWVKAKPNCFRPTTN